QLLTENVSLKDIVTISTTLLDSVTVTKDALLLTSDVRYALRNGIVNSINGDDKDLAVYTINNELENMLLSSLNQAQQAGKVVLDNFPVDPNILTQLQQNLPIIKE
ncbi:flagellar biosynthesis protein FlhA, partial [Yersinia pestis]